MNLNGFDVEEAKILRLSGKPQNAPEGMIQGLCELNQQERSGQGNSNTEALCVVTGEINWFLRAVPAGVSFLKVPEVEGGHNSYSEFI